MKREYIFLVSYFVLIVGLLLGAFISQRLYGAQYSYEGMAQTTLSDFSVESGDSGEYAQMVEKALIEAQQPSSIIDRFTFYPDDYLDLQIVEYIILFIIFLFPIVMVRRYPTKMILMMSFLLTIISIMMSHTALEMNWFFSVTGLDHTVWLFFYGVFPVIIMTLEFFFLYLYVDSKGRAAQKRD